MMTYAAMREAFRRPGDIRLSTAEGRMCDFFGISRQALHQWRQRGTVPQLRELQFEQIRSRRPSTPPRNGGAR